MLLQSVSDEITDDPRILLTRVAPISNLLEVLAQRVDNFLAPAVQDIPAQFLERDVNDVVMMQFFGRDFVAELEPDAVQQVDFLGCQPRGVRAKIKNFFLAVRRINFES